MRIASTTWPIERPLDSYSASSAACVAAFGGLFHGPDWVVRSAFAQRPFGDTRDLRAAFQEALFDATEQQQRDLMSSYPRLADVAGGTPLGAESRADQGTAGLTRLDEEDDAAFSELTAAYRDRFGFPLIVCVRESHDRDRVLESGWARMHNAGRTERAAALVEIAKIANHRFDDLVADANPIHSARLQSFDLP